MHTDTKRILFFPLSNVLGHLIRTLALAEEFESQRHDVYVAVNRTYARLTNVLPRGIRVVRTREMPASATRSFGMLRNDCGDGDAVVPERIGRGELRRRGKRLVEMIERDAAIIDAVNPDAIITDYHFTPRLLPLSPQRRLFHISHILGYPSFYRRVNGTDFYPLDTGHILVPGVERIEYSRSSARAVNSGRRESFCGMIQWRGWSRLYSDSAAPPRSDVFVFFGSTGNAKRAVPALLRAIPKQCRVSIVAGEGIEIDAHENVYVSRGGNLERFLDNTDVVFCHGGHGTVMECILHRVPMAIFPHNVEQLEIGQRIEDMGLGILVRTPCDQLSDNEVRDLIERLRTDADLRRKLDEYSALLRDVDGAREAAATVLQSLAKGVDPDD